MRQARRTSGLLWAQFAQAAGFSVPYLRSVENGNRALTSEVAGAYDRVLRTGGRFVSALHEPAGADPAAGWDKPQSMKVLTDLLEGGRVDRRRFFTAAAALSVSAASWAKALDSTTPHTGEMPQGPGLLSHISDRLDHLRRLDDELGSGDVLQLARGELALIVKLIGSGRYTSVEPRLYTLAGEASRQVGWAAFDQGKAGMAARYFDGALRASAEANDPIGGAYAASFAAIQCYSTPGQADRAIDLLQAARDRVRWHATPRMHAMLAARTARALSVTGAKQECAHQLNLARTALDQGPSDDDPKFLYWVDEGEIEMIAGSAALYLGDPAEALRRFAAALETYPGDEAYPRSHAIYLARSAEAHLAMQDLDAAVAVGRHAARCLGGVDSARSASELQGLRKKLRPHKTYPAVEEFLQLG